MTRTLLRMFCALIGISLAQLIPQRHSRTNLYNHRRNHQRLYQPAVSGNQRVRHRGILRPAGRSQHQHRPEHQGVLHR